MNKTGFTLAEILIVLGIIGLIADMTIPTLIQNTQKKVTAVKLQKIYSELSQVIELAKIDHGDISEWDFGSQGDSQSDIYLLNTYISPYIKTLQNCGTGVGCFDGEVYSISGVDISSLIAFPKLKTFSGNVVGIRTGGAQWANVQVYLNPNKKKAVVGKDVFYFIISGEKNKIDAHGVGLSREELLTIDSMGCTKSIASGNAGSHCSGLIQFDGWQIKDDYPW